MQKKKFYIYIYKYIKMLNKYCAVSEQKGILSDLGLFYYFVEAVRGAWPARFPHGGFASP